MKLTADALKPAPAENSPPLRIMKLQLLPSTFDANGTISQRQHLSCFVIDDRVAIDAGSLAMAATITQKNQIRNVVLTHAHLDHIAGLPLFIDDLFAVLDAPIDVYATAEVVEILERDVFNWEIYPRFSELSNERGAVLRYRYFEAGKEFSVEHLQLKPIAVNHKVPSVGFIISDRQTTVALTGDTAETNDFWRAVNRETNLSALLIECAFPNELEELAETSHHLTPHRLKKELSKFDRRDCAVYVVNIKPMYRESIVRQLEELLIENLHILEIGRVYEW
ncbi:MAG: 3',5'-cyclic-nucleotide phosphodiesterase [Acidobacteriota bacterium]|nr:3',5'-cyclic-nucleotide phosphodiesterase [Acidobacteriota bacterium]